jgi:hypothetical protein
LLIFDPTDPFTPLGYLPNGDQGGYALLIAGESGGVIQLPCAPPEANRTEVTVEGTLSPDGALEAKLALQDRANRAAEWRALKAFGTKDEFEKVVDAWLARNVKQVDRTQLDSKDSFDKGEFRLDVAFKAPRYAQVMQGRILVFKPSIVEPSYGFQTQAEKRVNPLVLESQCYHKQVRVTLPENFKIDEMPESASFRCSFGKYTSDYKVEGRELIFTEDFDVTATTLPVAQYSEAKEFFGRIAGAERAPLVMIRN